MPFDSQIDITIIKRYTYVQKQVLCYIFQAEDNELENRLAYELTERQKIIIEDIRLHIQEFIAQKQGQGQDLRNDEKEEAEELDKEIKWIGEI